MSAIVSSSVTPLPKTKRELRNFSYCDDRSYYLFNTTLLKLGRIHVLPEDYREQDLSSTLKSSLAYKYRLRSQGRITMRVSRHHRGVFVCLAASSSALNAGFAISFSSVAIKELEKGIGSIHLTTEGATWFGSLLPLMAMCGSLLSGPFMDQFGRRPAILAVVICFLISWIAMFSSSGYIMLFSGRGLSGLATGMCTAVIPVYISEVSPASLRGAMGGVFSIMLSVGLPLGYSAGILYHWRSIAELGATLACVTFIVCFLLPESPYWLVRQNRVSEATRCIQMLRGNTGCVSTEVKDIQCLQEDLKQPVKKEEIFSRAFLKPLLIGVALMVFQQLSGVNAIFFYSHEIFHRANFHNEILASVLVSTMHVTALILVTIIIDRIGRKKLLIISGISVMTCHAVLGGCMYILSRERLMHGHEGVSVPTSHFLDPEFQENTTVNSNITLSNSTFNTSGITTAEYVLRPNISMIVPVSDERKRQTVVWASWLSVALVMLYITSYSLGLGPIPYIALSEMLPQRGRGVACGIGTMSNWICAFMLTKSFVKLVDWITVSGVFWMFSLISLLSVVFVWRYVPETKGKTLLEIQSLFMNNNNSKTRGLSMSTSLPRKIIEEVVAASPLLRSKRLASIQEQSQTLMKEEC